MEIKGTYKFVIDEKLTEVELAFKEYYYSHPELCLDIARPFSENQEILQSIFALSNKDTRNISSTLLESHFLPSDSSVIFTPHARYLPATYHQHTFFEVCYLLKGNCKNYTGTEIIDMNPGDILILAPGTQHAISAFTDNCLIINLLLRRDTFENNFFNILNEKDTLASFFSRALSDNRLNTFLIFKTGNDKQIQHSFLSAYSESNQYSRFHDQWVNAQIQTFFIQLLRLHEKNLIIYDDSGIASDENIIFILRYMQENYRTLTLPKLASFFGYSERHMRRLLQENTGTGFSEMIQALKMQEAQNLLKDPEMKISRASELVGYGDISHFRRLFKKHFGITPAEYKQSLELEDNE